MGEKWNLGQGSPHAGVGGSDIGEVIAKTIPSIGPSAVGEAIPPQENGSPSDGANSGSQAVGGILKSETFTLKWPVQALVNDAITFADIVLSPGSWRLQAYALIQGQTETVFAEVKIWLEGLPGVHPSLAEGFGSADAAPPGDVRIRKFQVELANPTSVKFKAVSQNANPCLLRDVWLDGELLTEA